MMALYTAIIEYKDGIYINQIEGNSPEEAMINWVKSIDFKVLKIKNETIDSILESLRFVEERPVPVKNVKNIWCFGVSIDDDLSLVNLIKTVDQ